MLMKTSYLLLQNFPNERTIKANTNRLCFLLWESGINGSSDFGPNTALWNNIRPETVECSEYSYAAWGSARLGHNVLCTSSTDKRFEEPNCNTSYTTEIKRHNWMKSKGWKCLYTEVGVSVSKCFLSCNNKLERATSAKVRRTLIMCCLRALFFFAFFFVVDCLVFMSCQGYFCLRGPLLST